jgi:hypothetical protein
MNGIFLHTSWRSSGTWLWETLRGKPEFMGFYEPLHEFLPGISARGIAAIHSNNWQSRHPAMARPYFDEYLPLLQRSKISWRRKGVAQGNTAFAFDRFFMEPNELHEELYRYIKQLCDLAYAAGQLPVLKFARSQGRFAWFAKHFPDVKHALLIRQPWLQFRSGWRCMVEDKNPYFIAAPFMVLERNAALPEVAALIMALGLPVRAACHPMLPRLKHWIRAVPGMDAKILYRAAFALWLLNTTHALPAAALVLDGDAAPADIAAPFGLEMGTAQRPLPSPFSIPPAMALADIRACHDIALAALRHRLNPALPKRLEHWLAAAEAHAACDLAASFQTISPTFNFWRRMAGRLKFAA